MSQTQYTTLILGIGDASTADSVNLLNQNGSFATAGSLSMPPPPEPEDTLYGLNTQATSQSQSGEVVRIITCKDLLILGPNAEAMWANWQAIQALLVSAKRADKSRGALPRVVLQVQKLGGNFVYFDVRWGSLVDNDVDSGASNVRHTTLTLVCLPNARGRRKLIPLSGLISDGLNPSVFVPNVMSDGGALCQLQLEDDSTSTVVINRVRAATRHLRGMAQGDAALGAKFGWVGPSAFGVVITGATGGTFTLSWGGNTTGALAWNASAATVQTAFAGLASVAGRAAVAGSGTTAAPYVGTFTGSLATSEQVMPTADGTALTGTTPTISVSHHSPYTFADATAIGGSCIRVPASSAFAAAAVALQPAGSLNNGDYDVILRLRDSVPVAAVPGGLFLAGWTSGTLTFGATYTVQVTAVDSFGSESGPSQPFIWSPFATALAVYITIGVPAATAVSYNMYFHSNLGTQDWRKATGFVGGGFGGLAVFLGSDTDGAPSSAPVPGGVPAAGVSTHSQVIGLAALQAPVPFNLIGEVYQTEIGNAMWEHRYVGTFPLPPKRFVEGGELLPWQFSTQAAASSLLQPSFDFDCAYFVPHDLMESRIDARVTGLNLATKRQWIIDSDREGGSSGELRSLADGSIQGQCTVDGYLKLHQGNNLLFFMVEGQGGVSDAVNLKFKVALLLTPLYRNVGAVL